MMNSYLESVNEKVKQLQSLVEYGKSYSRFLKNQITMEELRLIKLDKDIPSEIIDYTEFFAQLDCEYEQNIDSSSDVDYFLLNNRIRPPYEKINNTQWRGYWLRATGVDCMRFLNHLILSLTNQNYQTNLVELFMSQFTNFQYPPHSVQVAEKMRKKYYCV